MMSQFSFFDKICFQHTWFISSAHKSWVCLIRESSKLSERLVYCTHTDGNASTQSYELTSAALLCNMINGRQAVKAAPPAWDSAQQTWKEWNGSESPVSHHLFDKARSSCCLFESVDKFACRTARQQIHSYKEIVPLYVRTKTQNNRSKLRHSVPYQQCLKSPVQSPPCPQFSDTCRWPLRDTKSTWHVTRHSTCNSVKTAIFCCFTMRVRFYTFNRASVYMHFICVTPFMFILSNKTPGDESDTQSWSSKEKNWVVTVVNTNL